MYTYIYINVRLLTMSKDSIFKTGYKHVSVKFYLYALLLLFCNCLLLAGCDCGGCCSFVDCGCFSSCLGNRGDNGMDVQKDEKVQEDSGLFWRILSYLNICKSPDEEKPKGEEIKNNNQEIKVTVIKTEDNKNVNEKVYDKKLEEADNENEMMIGGGEIIEQEEEEDNMIGGGAIIDKEENNDKKFEENKEEDKKEEEKKVVNNQNDILHSDSDDNTQFSSVNGEENEKDNFKDHNFVGKTKVNGGDGVVNNDKNTIIKKKCEGKEKGDDDNIDLASDPFYKALYFYDNSM